MTGKLGMVYSTGLFPIFITAKSINLSCSVASFVPSDMATVSVAVYVYAHHARVRGIERMQFHAYDFVTIMLMSNLLCREYTGVIVMSDSPQK